MLYIFCRLLCEIDELKVYLFFFALKIFATSGDKSQGGTHILYDPTLSERGALVCVARAPRKKSVDDFEAKPVIHNPHSLPLFRDQPSRKRQRDKILKDPLKAHKPDLPMTGPGFGGRVGTTQGSLLTQYLLKVICLFLSPFRCSSYFYFYLKRLMIRVLFAARRYDQGDMDGGRSKRSYTQVC